MSWNGATNVAAWHVLTGAGPGALRGAITVAKRAFETIITIKQRDRYVAVEALDSRGAVLAASRTVVVR